MGDWSVTSARPRHSPHSSDASTSSSVVTKKTKGRPSCSKLRFFCTMASLGMEHMVHRLAEYMGANSLADEMMESIVWHEWLLKETRRFAMRQQATMQT